MALLLLATAGCAGNGAATAQAVPAPAAAVQGAMGDRGAPSPSPSFSISGAVRKRATFDLATLKALPAVTQTAGGNSFTGASLWALLNDAAVGLQPDGKLKNATLSMYAVVTGSDGYRAVISLAEIDPEFGNRPALVAYSVNGAPLGRNGMARLVMPGDLKMGRSVARLSSIEILTAAPSSASSTSSAR
jgi:DMSO/TMAO reductase YedYZ molybdopterin-dependent catalytic subunit